MWRHIACSLQGPAHVAEESPCQDSSTAQWIGDAESGALVACVADGAGSAPYSSTGSRIACDAIVANALSYFDARRNFDDFRRDDAIAWCAEARQSILETAEASQQRVRDYATTLCAVVACGPRFICFQIGDGAIVIRNSGAYGVAFWPQSGEYANSTNFITAPDFRDHLEFVAANGQFSDVALLTDGIERLALDFTAKTPHVPFFEPLFSALQGSADATQLEEGLKQFLQSKPVTTRSDDDKSLILATRQVTDG